MRLIIAGGLKGQIIAAAKIAMSHGAAVTHTERLDQTLAVLRAKVADFCSAPWPVFTPPLTEDRLARRFARSA